MEGSILVKKRVLAHYKGVFRGGGDDRDRDSLLLTPPKNTEKKAALLLAVGVSL